MSRKRTDSPGFSHDTNQTRTLGVMMASSDWDQVKGISPFTQMASNPAKFDRCVRKVEAKGGVRNPYAVCNAALKG